MMPVIVSELGFNESYSTGSYEKGEREGFEALFYDGQAVLIKDKRYPIEVKKVEIPKAMNRAQRRKLMKKRGKR